MQSLPACPLCQADYSWQDGDNLNCPACGHIWSLSESENAQDRLVVRDANGNLLEDGDTVTVIKDLKVKGSSSSLKIGTRVKGIRLVEGDHNIDCKIDGFGPMKLKSEFVKRG
jgi:protein PhnA